MSSFSKYVGNGAQTVYAVNQPMPPYSALEVTLDGEVVIAGFTYNRTNATVTFTVAPADGVVVKLSRVTQVEPIHKFATGAAFTARNVDTNFTQESYRVEELQDNVVGVKELEESVLQASVNAESALQTLLYSSIDYIQVGTFYSGYDYLQTIKQTLLFSDGHLYGWTGAFPKVVPAGSTPTPLGDGGWVDRSDVTLRGDIGEIVKCYPSVSAVLSDSSISTGMIGSTIKTLSYYDGLNIGGISYKIVPSDTGVNDGGSYINHPSGVQLQALFNGVGKPETCGAKGDGVTDDSTAFTVCMNACRDCIELRPNANYRLLNVRLPWNTHTIINGNGATISLYKQSGVAQAGEHDCCMYYSNILNAGDTLRGYDNNTVEVNSVHFTSDTGFGGVGFRYIVGNHLWMNNCSTGGSLVEGVRVAACNDIHFNDCTLTGVTALRCALNSKDPMSAGFADVSFNDGIYVNGGTIFGTSVGIDYEGSSAEGVLIVKDVVLIGSEVAGVRAANFRNFEMSGCWTEFYKAGAIQVLLTGDAVGVEPSIAYIHDNFFTVYDFQQAGNIPKNVIYTKTHQCRIDRNYFQLQTMPTESVISMNTGNASSNLLRSNVNFTQVQNVGTEYGICSYEHFGVGSMILSPIEYHGIITDSAGHKFIANVSQSTESGMKLTYWSFSEVLDGASPTTDNPIGTTFKTASKYTLDKTLAYSLTDGVGSFQPFLGLQVGAITVVSENTFIMTSDLNQRTKIAKSVFGDLKLLPNNKFIFL